MSKDKDEKLSNLFVHGAEVKRPSDVKPESDLSGFTSGEVVTVGAKVYRELARFWTAQGKLSGRPVSDVIRDALTAAYGLPEGFPDDLVKPRPPEK